MPHMRVLMVSSEVYSLARTGGLGDAVEALAKGLAHRRGHGASAAVSDSDSDTAEVLVVTPRYGSSKVPDDARRWSQSIPLRFGHQSRAIGILEFQRENVRYCLIEDDGLYGREGLYGDRHGPYGDDALRFATMSLGALEISARAFGGALPDVIHAHDWHAALAIVYARTALGPRFRAIPSVFTIHNLAHQGMFDPNVLAELGLPSSLATPSVFYERGATNFLKAAVALADRVTAVSPTYARDIQTPLGGFGLHPHLAYHHEKLFGIANGIDEKAYDPDKDPFITARYDIATAREGKRENARALCETLGLAPGRPLFGLVARFAEQKGIDEALRVVPALVRRGASFVIVGMGEGRYERWASELGHALPRDVGVRIAFSEALARNVYAASDFFLVPSRFEPCGLTQMYAMRYGAIPIVSRTGGLRDTVDPIDVHEGTGTGFFAKPADARSLLLACEDALALYRDAPSFDAARVRAMQQRNDWANAVEAYVALYKSAIREKAESSA